MSICAFPRVWSVPSGRNQSCLLYRTCWHESAARRNPLHAAPRSRLRAQLSLHPLPLGVPRPGGGEDNPTGSPGHLGETIGGETSTHHGETFIPRGETSTLHEETSARSGKIDAETINGHAGTTVGPAQTTTVSHDTTTTNLEGITTVLNKTSSDPAAVFSNISSHLSASPLGGATVAPLKPQTSSKLSNPSGKNT